MSTDRVPDGASSRSVFPLNIMMIIILIIVLVLTFTVHVMTMSDI